MRASTSRRYVEASGFPLSIARNDRASKCNSLFDSFDKTKRAPRYHCYFSAKNSLCLNHFQPPHYYDSNCYFLTIDPHIRLCFVAPEVESYLPISYFPARFQGGKPHGNLIHISKVLWWPGTLIPPSGLFGHSFGDDLQD